MVPRIPIIIDNGDYPRSSTNGMFQFHLRERTIMAISGHSITGYEARDWVLNVRKKRQKSHPTRMAEDISD
jgi:hypothetical protein